MADLRIEEKSSSILPWIIGLILLVLAVWGVAELFEEEDDLEVAETEIVEDADVRGSEIVKEGNTYTLIDFDDPEAGKQFSDLATDYSVYTDNMTGEMGLDHEFSHNALVQLANSTLALASAHGMQSDVNAKSKAEMIRQKADAITKDPYAGTHADDIKAAAVMISEMLSEIQASHYPGLEEASKEVMTNAKSLTKETLTLNQKEDVRSFFGSARVLLDAMREQDSKMG